MYGCASCNRSAHAAAMRADGRRRDGAEPRVFAHVLHIQSERVLHLMGPDQLVSHGVHCVHHEHTEGRVRCGTLPYIISATAGWDIQHTECHAHLARTIACMRCARSRGTPMQHPSNSTLCQPELAPRSALPPCICGSPTAPAAPLPTSARAFHLGLRLLRASLRRCCAYSRRVPRLPQCATFVAGTTCAACGVLPICCASRSRYGSGCPCGTSSRSPGPPTSRLSAAPISN